MIRYDSKVECGCGYVFEPFACIEFSTLFVVQKLNPY